MAHKHEYKCDRCGKPTNRELLTVKKVLFLEMGAGGRTLRARVAGWLCPVCVKQDEYWNLPPHIAPEERPGDRMTNHG